MLHGHTDRAAMASSAKFGLTIIGGRERVAYPDIESTENPDTAESTNTKFVEHLHPDGNWTFQPKFNEDLALDEEGSYAQPISHLAVLNVNEEIWAIGGYNHIPGRLRRCFRLTLPDDCESIFQPNCIAYWKRLPDLLTPRSAFSATIVE